MTRLFVFCALSSALLVSSPAAAQQPEATDPTITIGPISLRPTFLIRNIGRDDNVFNDQTDPKRDFTMTFSPATTVGLKARRLKVSLSEGADYVYFKKYVLERGTKLLRLRHVHALAAERLHHLVEARER